MARLEGFGFSVAQILIGLSLVFSIWRIITTRGSERAVTGGTGRGVLGAGYMAIFAAVAGLLFLTLSIISRAVATGHGPFSNMYEFSVAFGWGILVMGFYFYFRYRAFAVNTIGTVVAFALLLFAGTLSSEHVPLVPALQQSFLLTAHVAAAVIAYGALTTGFGAAVLYLLKERKNLVWLPKAEELDEMSYHAVIIGFPFMT